MRARTIPIAAALLAAGWPTAVIGEQPKPVRVTVDNFARAETDTYFAKFVKDRALGEFDHQRELAPIDRQTVIRISEVGNAEFCRHV